MSSAELSMTKRTGRHATSVTKQRMMSGGRGAVSHGPGVLGGRVRDRPSQNAARLLSRGQLVVVGMIVVALGCCIGVSIQRTAIVAIGTCIAFYVLTAVLKLVIMLAGKTYQPPR